MAYLTLFIAPKPFTNDHIAMIQRNALRSWKELGADVDVILMGDEEGAAETAAELGLRFIADIPRNAQGTPLLSAMFALAREQSDSPLLAYVNADVMLLPDFLENARKTAEQLECFLIVGQRWDLNVTSPLDFSPGWQERLRAEVRALGRLHPRGGSDYFIYPRACFEQLPDFAIGRSGWDNWMLYEARSRGWPLVDASGEITVVHQDHDYSHLPGGQPHYRQPESDENVRLAGGKRRIFTLADTDCRLVNGKVVPAALTWEKFRREAEIFPLVRLHSDRLANLFFAVFHPYRGYAEFRAWLARRRPGHVE